MTSRHLAPVIITGIMLLSALATAATAAAPSTPIGSTEPAPHVDALGRLVPAGFAGPVQSDIAMVDTQSDAEDITLTLSDLDAAFGQETYKNDDLANTRNPDDLQNQTTTWETVIGHSLTATVDVGPGDVSPLPCDERFVPEAYISTSGGRLYGYTPGQIGTPDPGCVGVPGVRTFPLTFDLDGSPPTVTGSVFPALLPGPYVVTLNLYYAGTPSPGNPSGAGFLAGSIDIPFMVATPQIDTPETPLRLPESTLRMFRDIGANVGAANEYAMLQSPLPTSGAVDLTISFPGVAPGDTFERIDHYATRIGGDLAAPVDVPGPVADPTPLDELIDQTGGTEDRLTVTVQGEPRSLSNDTIPASGAIIMPVRGADFATQNPPTGQPWVPLQVVTILVTPDPDNRVTGAASLVIPVTDADFPVRQIDTSTLAPAEQTGQTEVLLQDPQRVSGGATGLNAGDLFALRPLGASHDLIAKARLSRDDPNAPSWVTGTFNHLTFPTDVGRYTLLGMLYGSNDEFYGMSLATRGVGLEVGALRIVEGKSGDLTVTVRNLADDLDGQPGEADYAITVNLTGNGFPSGDPVFRVVGPLSEGNSQTLFIPVDGSAPGNYQVVFTATSGELTTTRDTTIEVISTERAREENRKWYDVPGPETLLVTMALLAVVALARRRNA